MFALRSHSLRFGQLNMKQQLLLIVFECFLIGAFVFDHLFNSLMIILVSCLPSLSLVYRLRSELSVIRKIDHTQRNKFTAVFSNALRLQLTFKWNKYNKIMKYFRRHFLSIVFELQFYHFHSLNAERQSARKSIEWLLLRMSAHVSGCLLSFIHIDDDVVVDNDENDGGSAVMPSTVDTDHFNAFPMIFSHFGS